MVFIKLSDIQILQIYIMKGYFTIHRVASHFHISPKCVRNIWHLRGKRYLHLVRAAQWNGTEKIAKEVLHEMVLKFLTPQMPPACPAKNNQSEANSLINLKHT